jgi:hypothetical protein
MIRPIRIRRASHIDQFGFLGVHRQPKFLETLRDNSHYPLGIFLCLEPQDSVERFRLLPAILFPELYMAQ